MDARRSRASAIEFLDYLGQKGLMAAGTVSARKAAVGKVLGILDDEEAKDVTGLDIDAIMLRFSNLQGRDYTPQSLATYKSRVKAALDDFANYVENPLAFKPGVQPRARKASGPKSSSETPRIKTEDQPQLQPRHVQPATLGPMASSILPIPIRADLTVMVQGLPFDLTESEARKIAAVVQAMATSK